MCLGVSWITSNHEGGPKHVNGLFIEHYAPNKTHLSSDRFEKCIFEFVVWTFSRFVAPIVKQSSGISVFFGRVRVPPPQWTMIFQILKIRDSDIRT